MTRSYGLRSIENSTFQSFDSADWRIWFYLVAQLVGGALITLLLVAMLWPTTKRRQALSPLCRASLCLTLRPSPAQTAQPPPRLTLFLLVAGTVPIVVDPVSF